jgi:hypothetical protein
MIEVDYRLFGFLKAKQIFWGDYLPSCEGYDYIHCQNYFNDIPYHHPYIRTESHTSIIDLTKDSDQLFGQVHKKRRNILRQGFKRGYSINNQKLTPDILGEFQRLYKRFTLPKGALSLLTGHPLPALSPYMTVFIGEFDNIIYEIMLLIHDGNIVRCHKVTRNEDHPCHKDCYYLGSVLLWEVLMFFKELGYKIFDFGGIVLDPMAPMYPVSRYKMSFGGETKVTYWYQAKISLVTRWLDQMKPIVRRLIK